MRCLYTIGLIFLLAAGGLAQTGATVTGKVTQRGGAPDSGVSLTLTSRRDPRITSSTVSDVNGDYRFENVLPGPYRLSAFASAGGRAIYSSAEAFISIAAGDSEVINLELVSPLAIREVVFIGADSPQPIDEVSKTVNVITGQEMRERADFALADTLRTIPGFRVQQLGGFGRTASIKTRGLRNQDTAVLIDGIRFRDAASITGDATPFLSDFTLTSVSRIEVLRGSGSSLYGTNAIGGVIDFQTPRPQSGFHGQISGAAGGLGLGRFRANVSDGASDEKLAFNLGVSWTVYARGIDGEDDAHNTNFQGRLEWRPQSTTNLSGRLFVSDAEVRLNRNPDTLGTPPASNFGLIEARPGVNFVTDLNDPDDTQRSKFLNGQFVFTQAFGPNVAVQAFYSGLKSSRKNESGPLGTDFDSGGTSFFDGLIQTANVHLDWTTRKNKLTAGYEFEHEKFGNDGATPDGVGNFFTRAYQSSNTFYVQDLLALMSGRLNLAGGFRVQAFSLETPKFSLLNAPYTGLLADSPPAAYTFDGSASYLVAESGTKLRVHVGNGYRVPSLYERFGTFFSTFFGPEFVALGDPNLKPERTIAFDGGIEHNLFGEKAKLTAVYFYTRLIDTIGFGNAAPAIGTTERPFGGYENQKGGIARGAEFSASLKPWTSTDIFASYTYTNSDQRQPQVSSSGVITTLGVPEHQLTLVATKRIGRFWASVDFLGASSYLAPIFDTNALTFRTYVYRFKGNRRTDLTAGHTFALKKDFSLRLFGTIENLFDYDYYENGFRTPGRNGRVGLSFAF